jgi:hypothetical protein
MLLYVIHSYGTALEILLLLLIVPLGWPFIAKAVWGHEYSFQELVLNIVLASALAAGMWGAGRYAQMRDVEIINGAITAKTRETVSCEHSYSCNCTRNSEGKESCQTCYRHFNDYDWILHTSAAGEKIEISRVDEQGSDEPPRYTRAKIGDPVAVEHAHVNYVKAASGSLFHDKGEVLTSLPIPEYPNSVFDYHYVNRAITVGGVNVPDLAQWNEDIAMALRALGPKKEVNFVVVFANTDNPNYAQALERAWLGGKKNDVIVVLGTPKYPEIGWVRVLSWTDRQDFKIGLRNRLLEIPTVNREKIMTVLQGETIASFVRKPMRDFEYLKSEIDPPLWVSILAFILSTAASVGLSIYYSKNTVTFGSFFEGIFMLLSVFLRFRRG